MVTIPAGTFQMGSLAGEPGRQADETRHGVTLTRGFRIGKYPITQRQWYTVIGTNPSHFQGASNPPDGTEIQENRPVEAISWYDSLVFCNKLSMLEGLSPAYSISGSTNPANWGDVPTASDSIWNAVAIVAGSNGYRLPTEAQWEYACRAGTTTAYYYSDTPNGDYMWYDVNSNVQTHEVGLKLPNAWGLHDMHGNVYEWCWDLYEDYSGGSETDPNGALSGLYRIFRGGSYGTPVDDCRSAHRVYGLPSNKQTNYSLRVLLP